MMSQEMLCTSGESRGKDGGLEPSTSEPGDTSADAGPGSSNWVASQECCECRDVQLNNSWSKSGAKRKEQ